MHQLEERTIEEMAEMFESTQSGGKSEFQQILDRGRIQGKQHKLAMFVYVFYERKCAYTCCIRQA